MDAVPEKETACPAVPVYGPAGLATGGMFLVSMMLAVVDAVPLAPPLSVTVKLTVYVPPAAYVCIGVTPVPVAESPKSHE